MAERKIGEKSMGKQKGIPMGSELRKCAEKTLGIEAATGAPREIPPETMAKLIHELQVHQIELKMQNHELRRIQGELETARDKYSHLYDFAPVGYFTLSETGLIAAANLTFASMVGHDRGSLTGKAFHRFVEKDDQDIFYKLRQHLLETKTGRFCELRLVNRQGTGFYAHLECIVMENEAGESNEIRGVVSDISELKQVHGALRASEEKYRSMMNAMKDAAYICSSGFRIEYLNPAMVNRLGGDAVGKICHKAIYGKDEKCPWCVFDQVKKQRYVEYEMADSKINCHYSVTNSPIVHSDGTVSQLAVLRDITKTKTIEESLRQSLKMESIGTLAGGIAHDFNNILSIILGNAELGLEDVSKRNPAYTNLKDIKAACLRARNIVRQLLDFSRKSDQKLLPVKIGFVIKEALTFLRSTLPATIEIQHNIDASDAVILADQTQISQVMLNLCVNAFHAMEQTGGTITVAVKTVVLNENIIKDYPGLGMGKHIEIVVTDTGPGIRSEIINRIFDPYFTTKEIGKGTGMGLAVVQGIVNNHNGAVFVKNVPPRGVAFRIFFPLVEQTSVIETLENENLFHGTETILLIDDEISIVSVAKRMMERLGYTVEAATDPVSALRQFQATPDQFDLVMTDMTMPRMTGVTLSEEILKIRPDIPVIICSGYSALLNEKRSKLTGIAAYVVKPIVLKELAKTLRDVLDVKGSNARHTQGTMSGPPGL